MTRHDGLALVQHAFATGTMIATEKGEVPVETLAPGDVMVAHSGAHRRVREVRSGEVARAVVMPANSIGAGRPKRDLVVSSDGLICVKIVYDCQIPVDSLTYKSTFRGVDRPERVFWQIDLDEDDFVLAEDLPTRSGPGGDLESIDTITDRRMVDMVRAILMSRASSLGWSIDRNPPLDLHLVVDEERIEPFAHKLVYRFVVPVSAREVWLVSQCTIPKDVGVGADFRLLGAGVTSLVVDDDAGTRRDIPLADPRLATGFHGDEGTHRWTDGCALIPPALWHGLDGSVVLTVSLMGEALPRYCPPAEVAGNDNEP